MRKPLRAFVMVFALCCPVVAGEMLCPSVVPTPQPATIVQEPSVDGEIQNPQTTDGDIQNEAAATFVEVVLNLLALS